MADAQRNYSTSRVDLAQALEDAARRRSSKPNTPLASALNQYAPKPEENGGIMPALQSYAGQAPASPLARALNSYFDRQGALARYGADQASRGVEQVRGGDLSGLGNMLMGPVIWGTSPINGLLPSPEAVETVGAGAANMLGSDPKLGAAIGMGLLGAAEVALPGPDVPGVKGLSRADLAAGAPEMIGAIRIGESHKDHLARTVRQYPYEERLRKGWLSADEAAALEAQQAVTRAEWFKKKGYEDVGGYYLTPEEATQARAAQALFPAGERRGVIEQRLIDAQRGGKGEGKGKARTGILPPANAALPRYGVGEGGPDAPRGGKSWRTPQTKELVTPEMSQRAFKAHDEWVEPLDDQYKSSFEAGMAPSIERYSSRAEIEDVFGDFEDWPKDLRSAFSKDGNAAYIQNANDTGRFTSLKDAPSGDDYMRDIMHEKGYNVHAKAVSLSDLDEGLRAGGMGPQAGTTEAVASLARDLGWKVDNARERGSADSLYRYITLSRGDESLKVRISDHAKTSTMHQQPDINIAPGADDINSLLLRLTAKPR